MDIGTATFAGTCVTGVTGIIIALISLFRDNDRAVAKAVAPKDAEISRLREKVIKLGGDPDEP